MQIARIAAADDFEGWRGIARRLVARDVPADQIVWQVGDAPTDLFGVVSDTETGGTLAFAVPRSFLGLAHFVVCHRDPQRFALLYALLCRIRVEPGLVKDRTDPLLQRIDTMARAVRRDIHKMRAFLRFREVGEGAARRFVAWFEPHQHIVRVNAGFFIERFA